MGYSDILVTMNVYMHIGFGDAEEVLIMKLQSVEEFFQKRENVEKYNEDKINKLKLVLQGSVCIQISFLSENYPKFRDVNNLPKIQEFLEHYYDIGNIIPT